MSAFGGIADIGACLLYSQKRTLELSRAMSALCQKQTSGYFGSTLTCCSTTTGRMKAKIHGRGNRVLSDSRAPHLRQRHEFNLGANAASHCVMAEIVVRLFYSSAARLEDSGGTRRCCIHGLSAGQKLRDRGQLGRVSRFRPYY